MAEETAAVNVSYDIEIDSDLWMSFLGLCNQSEVDPHDELAQAIEEYIESVRKENDF